MKSIDPTKALVALGVIAAMVLVTLKAPSQMTAFGAAVGGIVLALMSVKKDGE